LSPALQDFIHNSVRHGLLGRQKPVAVVILLDLFGRPARQLDHQRDKAALEFDRVLGVAFDIRNLALEAPTVDGS
jgi:hypothetical protein